MHIKEKLLLTCNKLLFLAAVKEAIETLRRDNVDAFVLDLRNNSGGLFPEGIEIARIWLNKGVIVYICDSRGVRDIYDTDGTNAIAASEPLAVLVNKGTASASEILAGALKDNKRAVLLGEPTFGKGKIQSVFELSDGSGLAVTVARYETPDHIDINKVGITPDHPLPASFPKNDDVHLPFSSTRTFWREKMKPMPVELFGEMEEQASTVAMDVDDVEALDIFGEGPIAALDHHRLTDSDFFNSFEDDFDDADIN
ncbi:unnamed protein product [Lactuca virosa]|uniref:Tail specific protease domain-containing protein n=1 Tax=Lactuca virosa TaxID=75947 RepID=A0AAU9NTV3_9ASTR|nr:unnamed protein product [Lactuca virosa]